MSRRLRAALVRGQKSRYWKHYDGRLLVKCRYPKEEAEVPIRDIEDEMLLAKHVDRLLGLAWVPRDAVTELVRIAEGVRR